MKLIRGLNNLPDFPHGCIVTIGNFDGVHLGHQRLLKKLKAKGKELHLPTVVILFEPQPNEYFLHGKIPPRLMRLREKVIMIKETKIDYILCLQFNHELAQLSAETFIRQILVGRLNVRYVIVGDDFHFGYKRRGDIHLLTRFAEPNKYQAEEMPTFSVGQNRVSSTQVRLALENSDLALAKKLLGHPYCISGRVAHGDKRGRIIGFPTANIYLHRKAIPIQGVYAVKIEELEPKLLYGVANVGTRPTVDGTRSLLEVNIFNFDKEIYGEYLCVVFIKKLRDEKKFDSFDLLKQQIMQDAEDAKAFFQ